MVEGVGEVVISGPNVTPGYEGNDDANAGSLSESAGRRWFRAGDRGAFDDEGYLNLTGRLKEIINRGGEKVSPLEVHAALMDHPAIAQVVTVAMAHPKPGEEVAPLIGPHTTIASGVNGVPWWYFHKHGGGLEAVRLASVDPGDVQWNGIGPDRALGCVVYPAAEMSDPGAIRHIEGKRVSLVRLEQSIQADVTA